MGWKVVAALNAAYADPTHLLLDEIQNLPRWELFVSRLQRLGYRLFLTGSNGHLLSSELATHLTGRHESIVLFPFSFPEYIHTRPSDLTQAETASAPRRYAEDGGLPEPLFRDVDRNIYLRTLWDSVVYKDIARRHRVRSLAGIEDLASYLLANIASEYSLNRLTEVTRCKSVHTVQKYLGHLEEAFLFFSLRRFSFKSREPSRANRKIYCVDNGFPTSRGFQLSANIGRLCENLVAVALRKQQLEGSCEVFFWKGTQQEEVDFVVKRGRTIAQLIQVCWDMRAAQTRSREVRALLKASAALSCDDLLILTAETEARGAWSGTD